MSKIQEIFRLYAPEYLRRYGKTMPQNHKKVIKAIMNCRSGSFGTHLYQCGNCGHQHSIACSCGNRHCPSCQQHKAKQWLHMQMQNRLPCSYFLLTFTVPESLRSLIRSHQKKAYAAMFKASSEALNKLARDKRFVGADQLGFFGVLHTWGRLLQYHPHIHFVVPGGGLSPDHNKWLPSKPDFLVHVKALSPIFRAKFRDALAQAGLLEHVDPTVWQKDWVVHSEAVGNGIWTLRYLSRYVFRVAISNSRIISVHNHQVTFRYREVHGKRWKRMTLDAMEFIRRFLQHVLPDGFMKIRHFGFLSPNAKTPIQKIRELICLLYEVIQHIVKPYKSHESSSMICSHCGSRLVRQAFLRAFPLPAG